VVGKLLAVLIIICALASVWMFASGKWWFTPAISAHAPQLDAQFIRTAIIVAIAFTAAQLALAFAIFRYGRRGNQRAHYSQGSAKVEWFWTAMIAAVFISLGITGQSVWLTLQVSKPSADAVQIEVVAQQFQWNFHYAGADKEFGRTAPQYINDRALNFIGIDPTDANGKDDIQTTTLLIPIDRPVNLTLHSKDVIHSLFVPALRIKQDAVPGLSVRLSFTAQQTGKYEIACAELCGSLHYNMKAYLLVLTQEEYDHLVVMPDAQFKQRVSELFKQYN
jgi:cytochrome c oxidase subunit 2